MISIFYIKSYNSEYSNKPFAHLKIDLTHEGDAFLQEALKNYGVFSSIYLFRDKAQNYIHIMTRENESSPWIELETDKLIKLVSCFEKTQKNKVIEFFSRCFDLSIVEQIIQTLQKTDNPKSLSDLFEKEIDTKKAVAIKKHYELATSLLQDVSFHTPRIDTYKPKDNSNYTYYPNLDSQVSCFIYKNTYKNAKHHVLKSLTQKFSIEDLKIQFQHPLSGIYENLYVGQYHCIEQDNSKSIYQTNVNSKAIEQTSLTLNNCCIRLGIQPNTEVQVITSGEIQYESSAHDNNDAIFFIAQQDQTIRYFYNPEVCLELSREDFYEKLAHPDLEKIYREFLVLEEKLLLNLKITNSQKNREQIFKI